MYENLSLKARKLVKTIEAFIETAKKMKSEGKISEKDYNDMIKKKMEFLNKYDDGKIIRFVIPEVEETCENRKIGKEKIV